MTRPSSATTIRAGGTACRPPAGRSPAQSIHARGQVASVWIGTDDTPTSGTWSPTNTGGTNLVEVTTYVYDGGNAGSDGNLTQTIEHVDDSTTRTTASFYDWRNRLIYTVLPYAASEPILYLKNTCDNLDRAGGRNAIRT